MIAILLLLVLSGGFWLSRYTIVSTPPASNGISAASDLTYHEHFSTVTVDDIIEKLRAKSFMPPLTLEAPVALKPLGMGRELRPALVSIPRYFSPGLNFADQFSTSHWHLVLPDLELPVYYLSQVPVKPVAQPDATPANQEVEAFITSQYAAYDLKNAVPILQLLQQQQAIIPEPAGTRRPSLRFKELRNTTPSVTASATKLPSSKMPRWEVSMHFAPSMGYRNLFDGKNWVNYGNSPLMVSRLNVNQFVDHKPAMGFELGGGIRYRVSPSLVLKTGLQLNLTRYSIGAFAHSLETASIALNRRLGYRPDTLVTTSKIRNIAGNRPERLHNAYLQIGVPVGAELKIFGDQRFQVNVGGSLQPSYLLNTDQYQLSANFSNYVSESSLLRRWNLASSMEVFVTYNTGKVSWHIGPQFRYNLLSTFKKEYPIKENLMEYGLKIGVSRPIR